MATIAEEINNLKSRVSAAYDVCQSKGATIPSEKTTWNLSSTIESIPSGGGGLMPSLWGMPISTYVPYQDADGVIHSPSYTTRTSLTIDGPNHLLKLGDTQTLGWLAGILGTPEKKASVKPIVSLISSVNLAITSFWCVGTSSNPGGLTGTMDSMFQGIELLSLSVSNISSFAINGYWGTNYPTYEGGNTYIGSLLYGADAREICLPHLSAYNISYHPLSSPFSKRLEKFYAPNLELLWSDSGKALFKNQSRLKSIVMSDRIEINNSASLSSFMEGCSNMKYVPFNFISSGNQIEATYLCRNCVSLSAIDLSVSRETYNVPTTGQWTGAFSGCISLKTAKITYHTDSGYDLSSYAASDKLSGMFKGDVALERVDIYGIDIIGRNTAEVANTCTELMSGTKSGSQLWFHDLRTIYGYRAAASTYMRWKNLGCKDLYLPDVSLIDQLYVFSGLGATTTGIHFAQAHEAEIRASAGFATKWGAPSTCTIYFDL